MRTKAPPLLPIFRSEVQARVLALLLLHPERRWPSPELQRRLRVPEPTLRRELARLVDAGLVVVDWAGRTKIFAAATESPLYEPLRELLERTLGVEAELRQRLAELDGVELAAIFGSWAEERVRPGSDVDILVVGDVDFDEVADRVREVEEIADREVHLFVYGREELERKRAEGSGFVRKLLAGPLKVLVGDLGSLGAGAA